MTIILFLFGAYAFLMGMFTKLSGNKVVAFLIFKLPWLAGGIFAMFYALNLAGWILQK
jgi:hypothetical protein